MNQIAVKTRIESTISNQSKAVDLGEKFFIMIENIEEEIDLFNKEELKIFNYLKNKIVSNISVDIRNIDMTKQLLKGHEILAYCRKKTRAAFRDANKNLDKLRPFFHVLWSSYEIVSEYWDKFRILFIEK